LILRRAGRPRSSPRLFGFGNPTPQV
jgi:hypothetical protein